MSDNPGLWILLTTIISVITPLILKYVELYLPGLIKRFMSMFLTNSWKSSVQLVSSSSFGRLSTDNNDSHAYKAVIFKLMKKCDGSANSIRHIRQIISFAYDQINEGIINRNIDFFVSDYGHPMLLDKETETYVIPSFERDNTTDRTTDIYVLQVASKILSSSEILQLISSYQLEYLDYVKRYNKDGKLKYISLKKFNTEKDPAPIPAPSGGNNTQPPPITYSTLKRVPVWDLKDFNSSKTFDNVFFQQKDRMLKQIDSFVYGEEFYGKRGLPWNLNILMYGVPGCGKTSFIKALANRLKRHILDINLGCINTCQDFSIAFNTELFGDDFIPADKRIIVLEDIDSMKGDLLSNRSPLTLTLPLTSPLTLTKENPLEDNMNLSCFLNTLDGIHEHHGRILIATTNCPDKLDEAVLRRFNIKVEFTYLTQQTAEQIVSNYYDKPVKLSLSGNITGANLTHLCMTYQDDLEGLLNKIKSSQGCY